MSHTGCVVCDFSNRPKCTGYYIGNSFVHGRKPPVDLKNWYDAADIFEQRCLTCLRYDCWCHKDFGDQSEDERKMMLSDDRRKK